MSKQYGLILPNSASQQNLILIPKSSHVFNESSSSSDSDERNLPRMKSKSGPILEPGTMEKRLARKVQEKALAEDPTVFQYDELYDEIENKREERRLTQSQEPKKAKYITRLLETAQKRKLESELRVERQVQKEREAEGEQFKDKEAFVTSAYRKKLEEMRKMEENEKREEYLEAIGDVTKQKDLDGFYRHLYEQKLGGATKSCRNESSENEEIKYNPIKSEKTHQLQRSYRKRLASNDEENADEDKNNENKKVHLQNNIDADSDFSIDSSSGDCNEENSSPKEKRISKDENKKYENMEVSDDKKESGNKSNNIGTSNINKIKEEKENDKNSKKKEVVLERTKETTNLKKDIWEKRTVGEVFDAAVQRYYERKAARNAA